MWYGVRPPQLPLWRQAQAESRTWFYADNSLFDCVREQQFRITRNALQPTAIMPSDGKRFTALKQTVRPWKRDGRHIIVCPQSDEFMRTLCGIDDWLGSTIAELKLHTNRPIIIRRKGDRPLTLDLKNAWCLVTHMSAAAVEAIINGVPAICTGACAAQSVSRRWLQLIENPLYAERQPWLNWLADNQWSVDSIRDGTAWRALNGPR